MALVSPGVEVNIIDQSQYLPAASNSVPLVLVATAQNKSNAAGTAVAAGTTKATANQLYQITSQRDLVTLFGNPFFYKTTNGTPIHGYELNEYGLLATYSLLGTTNRCYVLRADIDLASLVGTLNRPSGEPTDGTYWLDTTNSEWGIYEFNSTTGTFDNIMPIVITDSTSVSGGAPLDRIGNIGDYAVVAIDSYGSLQGSSSYFYKTRFNTWEALGSRGWKDAIPTVTGSVSNPTLTAGNSFTITPVLATPISGANPQDLASITIAVPSSPNNNVNGLVTAINNLDLKDITAYNISGKLSISYTRLQSIQLDNYIKIQPVTGTVLADLGITPGIFFSPQVQWGPSSKMPLWSESQSTPHPTGSVWIKTSAAGNGLVTSLNKYSTIFGSFRGVNIPFYTFDDEASAKLDSTGGKEIPQDTVYGVVSNNFVPDYPIKLYKRLVTGPTVVTGTVSNPTISSNVTLRVGVSLPGSSSLPVFEYTVRTTGTTLDSFITDWSRTNIPNTTITKTTNNQVQITHKLGGQIYLFDIQNNGTVSSLLTNLGLVKDQTLGVKNFGPYPVLNVNCTQTSNVTGTGTGAAFQVARAGTEYFITQTAGGAGHQVGDVLVISGEQLGGTTPTNDLTVKIIATNSGAATASMIVSGTAVPYYPTVLSNWVDFDYIANEGQPVVVPNDGKYWYYSTPTQVDIMVNKNGTWKGYGNVKYDANGHPAASGSPNVDPGGPIVAAVAPTQQTDGTSLNYGDLWIDSADLENYPMIYRWQDVKGIEQWVLVDKTDQISSNGILFADARWATNGSVDPVQDPIPSIASLLTSDYTDLDCPNPTLYPQGMLLFNTRRSGYNVKELMRSYFVGKDYPAAGAYDPALPAAGKGNLPIVSYTWVSASGLKADGSAYMGRKAQRAMVVMALRSAISTNQSIREEDNFFNLIAAPGYPELQPDMVTLNNDRHNTAYIVGDTPFRLGYSATAIANWAKNEALATASGEDGWVTRDSYLGVFYPSGITTDLTGSPAVVPPSHMMLRTLLRNDTLGYPWLAPAGTRRGTIDNATNIGYIDAGTGEFQVVKNRMSIRDVLYTNQINPLAFFTGVGLLNYGNKNSFDSQSALDRINVSRLVAYIRERLQVAARPFVFEPNDALTRQQITSVVQSLFIDLVAKRGLYDYLVVCDSSNNTPSRIDRNELWIDIAIEPVKAAEFIYIPVRLMNTGALGK